MNKLFPIKLKLIIYTLSLIIISIVTMGYINDRNLQTYFKNNAKVQLKEVFSILSNRLSFLEQNMLTTTSDIQSNKLIIDKLIKIKNNEKINEKYLQNTLLNNFKNTGFDHISIYDTNKNLVSYINLKIEAKSNTHIEQHLSIDKFQNNSVEYKRDNSMLTMQCIQPIFEKNNEKIGYVKIDNHISIFEINQFVNDNKFTLDYLFSSDDRYNEIYKKYVYVPLLFSNFSVDEMSLVEDQQMFYSAVLVATKNGSLLINAKTNNYLLTQSLQENRQTLYIITFILLFITIAFSLIVLNKMISLPLKKLIYGIDIISKGDYEHKLDINYNDELGVISKSFNSMAKEIKRREEELDHLAHNDMLTQIPNRAMFIKRLNEAISRAKRVDKKLAVIFLDLDQFKIVNDTLGHDVGDKLLIQVSKNLSKHLRNNDLMARIGGDEFNILIEDIDSPIIVQDIVQKILTNIQIPYEIDNQQITITGSAGIALYPDDAKDTYSLLKNADLAMYDAKNSGRNGYKFFSDELSIALKKRTTILKEMKKALSKGEFELYYQPKFDLETGYIISAEALIRWNSETLGFMPPDKFIPLAEESGMIVEIGEWVIQQACKDFASWKKNGINLKQVSINVSNIQFMQSDVVEILKNSINENSLLYSEVEVEITESYIHKNPEKSLEILNQIRALGIDLAIDDFGTGYSSMSYLKKMPITRLKIDKSFINDIPNDNEDIEITKAIVALAKVLKLQITTEGVETLEQVKFLKELKCDEAQGYICAKPLPNKQFVKLVKKNISCTFNS